ncbi:small ribosomal subunit Rsm22 family protein [Falsochrobactrum ovis]|uniref:Ribosomal protein RSM22 (Predicted rRNA methylase) n=1 Tax=Falsochrobactrum ovis TaxID=1293442 RepID=A0A364JX47_9HYPH|nr:small ribosomal subunit Rsm22 family protein [Falsochrobactrum ovis]RAK32031.1 ribosomal protein RSM22 (predicted rRNA methylase) [Falsochrobactrum ovis]
MELPSLLRQAVDQSLEGVPLADLKRASEMLSRRYRAEVRDGKMHISDQLAAQAYLAARLPATFAAVRASFESVAEICADFSPKSMLDVGSGPGTALWAAKDCWSGLASATLVEASPAIRALGQRLAVNIGVETDWRAGNLVKEKLEFNKADLVTITYVLDELEQVERSALIEQLWASTQHLLLIVEPGTPAGWERILAARKILIERGAKIAAPCTHHANCPILAPDWCHFSRRVARSKIHRLTKSAEVPWEDEKFIYLAAARDNIGSATARVIAPPRIGGGKVSLKLCQQDGSVKESLLTKRDGEVFRWARRADWGDVRL